MPKLPGFAILPGDVNRVIEMQQQPLAAIKKSKAEKIVINEGQCRPDNNVDQAEGAVSILVRDCRA